MTHCQTCSGCLQGHRAIKMAQVMTVMQAITVRAVDSRALTMVVSCHYQLIRSTAHRPLVASCMVTLPLLHLVGSSTVTLLLLVGSSMVTLHLLRLVQLLTVTTVGSTVRIALPLLHMVSLVTTVDLTVRLWVPRVPQGLQGGPPAGQLPPSGTLRLPKEVMG